jgi:hypothetical protein
VAASVAAGVDARYREIRSTKGHDAFLVEWDQLTSLLREALSTAGAAAEAAEDASFVSEWQSLEA